MTQWALLYPVLVQVALTFALLFWMEVARVRAVQEGRVRMDDIALGQSAWPERETLIANSFHNQLQLPVLFYALATFAVSRAKVNGLLLLLAWVFVALRLAHAWVHVTANRVPARLMLFVSGALVLLVMWVVLALRLLFEGV